jgi:hypothetical protein
MVGVFRTDLFRHSNGTRQSYFGAKPLSIGITQRTPERAMSSALCEEARERIADEQNRLNKKADAPRTQAACLDSCRPTTSEIVIVRRRLKRRYVLPFFQKLPPCLVGIEACASSPSLVARTAGS